MIRPNQRRGNRSHSRAPLESLEPRRLLSSFVVDGTVGNDQISIDAVGGFVTVKVNGVQHTELDALVSEIIVNGLDGDDVIRIGRNTDNLIFINGGTGDDTFIVADASGSLTALGDLDATIFIDGGEGENRVEINDAGRPEAASYVISPTGEAAVRLEVRDITPAPLAPLINVQDVSSLILRAGTGDDFLRLDDGVSGIAVELDAGAGDDVIEVASGNPEHPTVVIGNFGIDDLLVAAGASVELPGSQEWGELRVGPDAVVRLGRTGGVVFVPGEPVSRMRTIDLSPAGTVDVGAGTLLFDYSGASPIGLFRQRIQSGFAGGTWSGRGILSTSARDTPGTGVGYADATELFSSFPATFAGRPIDSTTLIARWTLIGDADLNREVGLPDFARLASGFNAPATWARGDFNYDGQANLADFSLLAGQFNRPWTQTAGLRPGRELLFDLIA